MKRTLMAVTPWKVEQGTQKLETMLTDRSDSSLFSDLYRIMIKMPT